MSETTNLVSTISNVSQQSPGEQTSWEVESADVRNIQIKLRGSVRAHEAEFQCLAFELEDLQKCKMGESKPVSLKHKFMNSSNDIIRIVGIPRPYGGHPSLTKQTDEMLKWEPVNEVTEQELHYSPKTRT